MVKRQAVGSVLLTLATLPLACTAGADRGSPEKERAEASRSQPIRSGERKVDGGARCPGGGVWLGAHCFVPCKRDADCPGGAVCVCPGLQCHYDYVSTESGDHQPLRNVCVPLMETVLPDGGEE